MLDHYDAEIEALARYRIQGDEERHTTVLSSIFLLKVMESDKDFCSVVYAYAKKLRKQYRDYPDGEVEINIRIRLRYVNV